MRIEFLRTGERRYAVRIHRRDLPALEMNPAPGFDPLMPHDLLHYVVESELGLRSGIFGQVASGGDAGTFHEVQQQAGAGREASRRRRRLARRGAKLLRDGREDSSLSERAVYTCHREWVTRRKHPERRSAAARGSSEAYGVARAATADEVISDAVLDRVVARLESLSERWARLGVGESLVVEWPEGGR